MRFPRVVALEALPLPPLLTNLLFYLQPHLRTALPPPTDQNPIRGRNLASPPPFRTHATQGTRVQPDASLENHTTNETI